MVAAADCLSLSMLFQHYTNTYTHIHTCKLQICHLCVYTICILASRELLKKQNKQNRKALLPVSRSYSHFCIKHTLCLINLYLFRCFFCFALFDFALVGTNVRFFSLFSLTFLPRTLTVPLAIRYPFDEKHDKHSTF